MAIIIPIISSLQGESVFHLVIYYRSLSNWGHGSFQVEEVLGPHLGIILSKLLLFLPPAHFSLKINLQDAQGSHLKYIIHIL